MRRDWLTYTVIAIVILAAAYLVGYGNGYVACKRNMNVVHDTVRIKTAAPIESHPIRTMTIPVYIPQMIDTDAVLRDYFAKNVYVDTVEIEKFGFVTITDTVLMNGIDSRFVTYDLKVPNKKKNWSMGVGLFGEREAFGVVGSVRYRHFNVFGGYDFLNKSPLVGGQYIIEL